MTLPDLARLAQSFDSTDPSDTEKRIAIAEQMRPLLGDAYDDFDRVFESVSVESPQEPATQTLKRMGFLCP